MQEMWHADWHKDFPILIVDDEVQADTAVGRALDGLILNLEDLDFEVVDSSTYADGLIEVASRPEWGAVLVDWDLCRRNGGAKGALAFIEAVKTLNTLIPVFLLTERLAIEDIPSAVLERIAGYVWITEDTPDFIAGRIEQAVREYVNLLLPPFFAELVRYTEEYKYAWHTPGHTGGTAFLKSPVGQVFFRFFGENMVRSDLSVSVPELGSLLEQSGVVGQAARNAARAFGADQTYFVTNGTSTANKMVLNARITPGEVILMDRNCHKSLTYGMILTRPAPVYFVPERNFQGIIGPIPLKQFSDRHVRALLKASPLTKEKTTADIVHAVVTNSTYDGLCYHTGRVIHGLRGCTPGLHFDEAWYAYAVFHPMYQGRYATYDHNHTPDNMALFATQSTHKLLAAFSQASMIHIKDSQAKPRYQVDRDRFAEAFMMHTSTSPQYGIIASLDVATRMMQYGAGRALISDCIAEAVTFRKKMTQSVAEFGRKKDWFFSCWQPDKIKLPGKPAIPFAKVKDEVLCNDPHCWHLDPKAKWHGFSDLKHQDYCLLDPIKVTIVCPGINLDGSMPKTGGIPAGIVSAFLMGKGIVPEKTNFYSFLMLFSMGVTKGKSGTLLAGLFEFKRLYDNNVALIDVLPDLAAKHPDHYKDMGLRDLAENMHQYYQAQRISHVIKDLFEVPPPPVMTPARAYDRLVKGRVREMGLNEIHQAQPVAAVMVVPYPPGIPIIMPGERFNNDVCKYLTVMRNFDRTFPGFETENHGVETRLNPKGMLEYYINCLK